jgi:hypothetical protein
LVGVVVGKRSEIILGAQTLHVAAAAADALPRKWLLRQQ